MDPLRAGAVSIIGGRIVHFCSVACRETRLRGAVAHPPVESATGAGSGEAVPAEAPPPAAADAMPARGPSARRGFSAPVRRWLRLPLIENAGLLAVLGVVLGAPAGLLRGLLPLGAAATAVAGSLALAVAAQRRAGAARMLEAAAVPLAGAAMLAAGIAGDDPGGAALFAVVLLLAWRAGRLLETLGRSRSGVLEAVLDGEARVIAREWRDNSLWAERIRRVAIALEWLRIPLAAGLALGSWQLAGLPADRALLAGAIALVALEPRVLRMITGDAHLGVALAASRHGVVVRDARAVEQAGLARIALFLPQRCLFEPGMAVAGWRVAPEVEEGSVLETLAAVEADAPGRVAEAVRAFLAERGVTARPAEEREIQDGLGVAGRVSGARVLAGSRSLMLREIVSTAVHEGFARDFEGSGRRAVFLAVEGTVAAVLALEERPLAAAFESVRQLAVLGVEPAMITGAEVEPALALGARLGIENVRFETPEERLGQVLAEFAEAGEPVLLIGHGPGFEESFRGAAVAVCCGGDGTSMAGIDVRDRGLEEVVGIVRLAREAAGSVRRNAVAATASVMAGLALAAGWQSFGSGAAAAALVAAAAGFATFNAPYPGLARLLQRASGPLDRLRRRIGLARSPSR